MHQYDSLQLALFSGKGGVGKTTLSCGFARRWAKQFPDQQILLVSTDPAHSLGDVLQVETSNTSHALADLPNLQVRSLDAAALLQNFKARYGRVLELLVERGSFVQGEDLSPVWNLSWPGLDELMGILEIQRLLREGEADRVVVDMAPSGHTINLFKLVDFLDELLAALELFQEKHRVLSQSFTGRYTADDADAFLHEMKAELLTGRQLLQNPDCTACLVVAIAEPMSFLETRRFLEALNQLQIPLGGLLVNHILTPLEGGDRYYEQQEILGKFQTLGEQPIFTVPQQLGEPVGSVALDHLVPQIAPLEVVVSTPPVIVQWPTKVSPGFEDFMAAGRQLLLVGGKGGVGKTTVAAAIAWGMAEQHPDRQVRVISIDPAHSLGDAFGQPLGHQPTALTQNLTGQEIDASQVLEQFREEYLWELAEMMSGDSSEGDRTLSIAYGPEAWRRIAAQALPGIDEMLSLITVIDLLERQEQDLIILDTAPTGHLLRFLEMPTALGDWLAWIFKLWIKYQDVLGRTEFMGRLRSLRQRVMQAQKRLQDPKYTEFILVLQAQSAIVAEGQRLAQSLAEMGVPQRYVVHNRFAPELQLTADALPQHTMIHLPVLPRSVSPLARIQGAAELLF
ncbi:MULTISPECIES: ArsA family ATPase [Trichocoleus]|uniref:ArsA family ATPase n=1 Tax=Trichocoleus desertorum GB2-A4 TaxID=2933944 RepID=A0ABV0J8S3_9CYAN|nr:ArsA family ATPase [Trichocoleus sp. FACHB-46]MBD1861191.1 ArsA family ATPase [Trichocoleus sp. FACHB-46]